MDVIVKLDEAQIDGLKEISNIGAGHAATALSQMTRHSVMTSARSQSRIPIRRSTVLAVGVRVIRCCVSARSSGSATSKRDWKATT